MVGCRSVGHVSRGEFKRRFSPRRDRSNVEVVPVDRMGAVAGRLTIDRENKLCGGRDSGELGDLGFGFTGVNKDVEAMGGSEP